LFESNLEELLQGKRVDDKAEDRKLKKKIVIMRREFDKIKKKRIL